jgi:Na+-transporting NADH:ubiquinone oxidoreductase subunit F
MIIRRVPNGICTTYCFDYLKTGDTVKINGPYGDFKLSNSDAPMIFIAGGSGMAPFVSILNHMKTNSIKRKTDYYFGGNEKRDMFFEKEMRAFETELGNFNFVPVIARPTDNWKGKKGLVTEAVQESFTDLSQHEGYLCGSPGMIDASIKVLCQLGMKEDKIYYDKFA